MKREHVARVELRIVRSEVRKISFNALVA
jgi:hypothetical protein